MYLWLTIFSTELKYFSKKSNLMVHWEKKYYAIRIEFQESGSPHARSFIWIFNAPNIQNEIAYIEFIE